jgi:hypothetical protein
MGRFQFRNIGSMLHSPHVPSPWRQWLGVLWRDPDPALHPSELSRFASPYQTFRFSSQSCAINLPLSDRANQSIQRVSLARTCFSAASALRRWMLPTVERGPPGSMRLDIGW